MQTSLFIFEAVKVAQQSNPDIETRMEGMEANLKLILEHLKVPSVASAAPPLLQQGPSAMPTLAPDAEKVSA